MKTVKLIAAIGAAASMMAASAQAQTFDNRNLLGAGIGAGLGGVIGSQVAGSGARTEGSAIGAVVGGLAGYSAANSQRFDNRNLAGAGIGAGLGGVIGSQVAGSGARTEGSLIGAAIGGLAGYGIANATRPAPNYGYGYGGGYNYGGSGYGHSTRYASAPTQYGTFGGSYAPAMPAQISSPISAPTQYVPGGYVYGGSYTVPSSYSYTYQPQPQIVQHKIRTIRHNPVRQVQVYQAPLKHYSSSCSPCAAPKKVVYHAPKPQPVQMNSTLVSQSCAGACPSVSTSYQGKIQIDPAALRNAPPLPEPHHGGNIYCKSGCR